MQNLSELMHRLISSQVEFVLVGGFAAAAHGVTQVTLDVDICCRFSEANLMRIRKAFADLHPVHRSRPDFPLELSSEQRASLNILNLKTELVIVDRPSEVLCDGNIEADLKHSVEVELPYSKCRILDIDALIRAKEAMN